MSLRRANSTPSEDRSDADVRPRAPRVLPQDGGPVLDDDRALGFRLRCAPDHEKPLHVARHVVGVTAEPDLPTESELYRKKRLRLADLRTVRVQAQGDGHQGPVAWLSPENAFSPDAIS
jgi:hypothetical protein